MVLLVAAIEGSRGGEVLTQDGLHRRSSFFPGSDYEFYAGDNGSRVLRDCSPRFFEKRGWNVATCCDDRLRLADYPDANAYDVVLLSCQVAGTTGSSASKFDQSFQHRKMTA
jgi:hypothetical protein